MAALTITDVSRAGVTLSGAAATATTGDTIANTGKEVVVVNNAGGSPITVTIKFGPNAKVDGQAATDRTVAVTNGASRIIGPFPVGAYNDAQNNVTVICSAVTSVTVQALRVTPA